MSIVFTGVAKRYADTLIFENVSLELHPRERVGLLGRNGSGKTTLMRLAAGLERPDGGSVSRTGRAAHLAQRDGLRPEPLGSAVLPEAHIHRRTELEAAAAGLETPTHEHLAAYAEAEERYRVGGGYDLEARAASVLGGLGLDPDVMSDALSGGQARRALLARLLVEPADFYLLDEPTNHLDLEAIAWLEGWVRDADASFLVVSHDRAFLDNTVTRCLELERGRLHAYPGGYSEAMAWKAAERENALERYKAHERKVEALTAEARRVSQQAESAGKFSHKKKRWGSTMSAKNKAEDVSRTLAGRARAIERRVAHMGEVEKPFEDRFLTRIRLEGVERGPNEVLTLEGARLERGGRVVLDPVDLHVRRGERVALTGPNGAGKSTLLAALVGRLELAGGEVRHGHGLTVYWAGQGGEELSAFATLEDALLAANPDLETRELYALLASLGLPKEPGRRVADLSGGQRTRLSLARLCVTRAHLLVLDEPTNDLDLDAVEALERLLLTYPGTVVFASHDRRLVDTVATRRLRVEGGRIADG